MTVKLKGSDGVWKNIASIYLKNSGVWKNLSSAYLKVSGSWKLIFSSSLTPSVQYDASISQSTNGTTYLVTLTGTNYYWTNADTLSYKFEQSVDNEATWTILSSGTATNPSSGSSNTYTYQLIDNFSDVTPNIENIYRFVVTGTNTTYNTSLVSTDNTTSVYGPEDITITTTGKSYNSVDLDWTPTAAPNAQKYLVYFKLSSDSSYTFSKVIATTSTTVDSLSSSTAYNFKVVPITGVSNTYKGYRGNDSNVLTVTTDAPAVPTQLTSPTISGSGYAFTAINGTSGTYQSGTFQSKTTYIGETTSSTAPTSGTTTAMSVAGSPPYNVTQYDATAPKFYFYYVDAVTANDGVTVYYYYSSGIDAKIGQVIDNFTRTVSGGLGTMTPAINSAMSPNAYIYNVTANGSLWSVNGSVASIASAVSGSDPYTYPQQSVTLDGATDAVVAASFPSGSDGLGLTFWSTGAGSWWASRVNRTTSLVNKYVYYTLSTVCDTVGSSTNSCRSENVITQVCTAGQGTISNNCGVVTTCPENGIGSQVTKCRTRTNDLCLDNGAGNSATNCKSRIIPTCTNNGSGSSGTNCKSRTVQTCPNNNAGSTSSNCKTRSGTICPNNSGGGGCKTRTVTTCPNNGLGGGCKTRTVTTQTCPNNNAGSTSSNCKTRTVTTYSCPTGYSLISGLCYQNAFPYAVTSPSSSSTTVYDNYVSTDTTVSDSYVDTTVSDSEVSVTYYDNYVDVTVYDAAGTTTVYDAKTVETIYDGNVDTYSGNVPTSTTVYYQYGCTIGPTTQYGGSLPTNCSNTSSSVTVYDTKLNILNANGSTASIVNTENIFSNEESPSTVGGMSVTTSGNSISTTLYSNTARTSTITTKSYTPTSPTKSTASGQSAFGIIKTPPGAGGGATQFDDFQIN